MARYRDSVCKLCRREGTKLFLKGERCYTDKCAYERRGYAPGEHGRRRRMKESDYGHQLREKQKARRMYGVGERQFRNFFFKADRQKGVTGEVLFQLLERRLDNIVYRLAFAPSRASARQLVRHRHFTVNDRIVDIPSYTLRAGDTVKVRNKSRELAVILNALEARGRADSPSWLDVDAQGMTGKLLHIPEREEMQIPVQDSLIVELYSK
jgi:small subunit ribosomal protein S4